MKNYLSLILLMLGGHLWAQRPPFTLDEVLSMSHGTSQLMDARDLGVYYLRNDMDSLKVVIAQYLLSEHEDMKALGYRFQGGYAYRSGDVSGGVYFLNKSAAQFAQVERWTFLSEVYNELGNAHWVSGDYLSAGKNYRKSLDAGKNALDNTARFNAYLGLGKTKCVLGDSAMGIFYVGKYLEEAILHEAWESASSASGFLSDLYTAKNDEKLADAYLKRSIGYAQRSGSLIHLSNVKNNAAMYHFRKGELDSSELLFRESFDMRKEVGQSKEICESYYNLGVFYLETGDTLTAVKWWIEGEKFADEMNMPSERLDLLNELQIVYSKQRDSDQLRDVQREISVTQHKMNADKSDPVMEGVLAIASERRGALGDDHQYAMVVTVLALLMSAVLVWHRRA